MKRAPKIAVPTEKFPGPDYSREHDQKRLQGQQGRIFEFMKFGQWLTLREINEVTQAPEASISAQLRLFRRPRSKGGFGLIVEKRRRGDPKRGVWEYKLTVGILR